MDPYKRAIVHSGDSAFTERCALVARNSPHSPLVTRRMHGVNSPRSCAYSNVSVISHGWDRRQRGGEGKSGEGGEAMKYTF